MPDNQDINKKIARYMQLTSATTRPDLAKVLNVSSVFLTKVLYKIRPENLYETFEISKKSGGVRKIFAPKPELKELQSSLSTLLLDCIDAINHIRKIDPKLSHGFCRNKSIITNAKAHKGKALVLNTDIMNFFDSFNFGRVRGFFIKNRNFNSNETIATTIAQIACYQNSLPQGSPCSPVISNLISHSMDIRLASLSKKYSLTYTRYADDLTFSTNKKNFPEEIVVKELSKYKSGNLLRKEIINSGFEINESKTRLQFKDSRQDVTGLVVNQKVNTKREYWRTERSKCHWLFTTGDIPDTDNSQPETIEVKIKRLYGRLSYIDSIDKYNRESLPTLEQNIVSRKSIDGTLKNNINKLTFKDKLKRVRFDGKNSKTINNHYDHTLNSREKLFSDFLFYINFFNNSKPIIISEGKTDNIYLKCAIESLGSKYPNLVSYDASKKSYKSNIYFFKNTSKTRFLLELYGGADHIVNFINSYKKRYSSYLSASGKKPVIVVLDNDSGPNKIINNVKNKKNGIDPRTSNFIHIEENLYLVLTPQLPTKKETCMEDFFHTTTLNMKIQGRSFNPSNIKISNTYGKNDFATQIIQAQRKTISFSLFQPILDRINEVILHNEKRLP